MAKEGLALNGDEWAVYQKLVLSELDRLNKSMELVSEQLNSNRREIEVIKVKSGFFGSISAALVVMFSAVIEYFRGP